MAKTTESWLTKQQMALTRTIVTELAKDGPIAHTQMLAEITALWEVQAENTPDADKLKAYRDNCVTARKVVLRGIVKSKSH